MNSSRVVVMRLFGMTFGSARSPARYLLHLANSKWKGASHEANPVCVRNSSSQHGIHADAPDVSALAEAYQHPALGKSHQVTALKIDMGAMQFRLESGAALVVTVAGQPSGIFFKGSGHYSYLSHDPVESGLFTTMAAAYLNKPTKSDRGLQLDGSFSELYLLAGGMDLPHLDGAETAPLDEAFRAHQQKFSLARWPACSDMFRTLSIRRRPSVPSAPTRRCASGS